VFTSQQPFDFPDFPAGRHEYRGAGSSGIRRKVCERLVEVVTQAEQIFCRTETGPLLLGPGRQDARDWHISAGHEDLLARLDSSQ
jgi:hypothetical protein